ncbi:MAG: peptidoglycan-associated lipoprotein Pal [Syntrophaceae bacterium]
MSKNIKLIGVIGLCFLFSFMVITGCAKKSVVKEEAVTTGEQSAAQAESKEVAKTKEFAGQEKVVTEGEAVKEKAAAAKEEISFKDINFDFDKYNLNPDARDILKQHADILTKNKYNVLIEGHCDERGTTEYNLALGEKRAKEAKKYFIELGIGGKKIKTVSYGKERPLNPEHNEEAWAQNRRDHFVVKP